jgi:hypothetical protein
MGLPPNRLDDLRDIARALGQGHPPPPPSGGSPRGWVVAVLGGAVLAVGWAAARTCGFRGGDSAPQVAVRLARVIDPSPSETPSAPDAPNALGALLDRERVVALPVVEATVALPASPEATPTMRARAWDRVPATPRPRRATGPPRVPAGADPPAVVADVPRRGPGTTTMPEGARAEPDAAHAARDLTGAWLVTNTIQESSRGAFRGLRIRFRVELRQDGNRLTGRGRKFTVDDRPVAPGERTPIDLEGEIRDGQVVLRFVEHGRWRATRGAFRWRVSSDGERLVGSFDSTAAATAGVSSARRDG